MALPKKGIRYLDVDGTTYFYGRPRVEWQGLQIYVTIGLKEKPATSFVMTLPYERAGEPSITPAVVREGIDTVIAEYGEDWPNKKVCILSHSEPD
jgi:hypothetical protein